MANEGLVTRLRFGTVYWVSNGREFRRAVEVFRRFVGGFVEKALARVEEAEGRAVERFGLLGSLTAQTKNREDLVSQMLGRFVLMLPFLDSLLTMRLTTI